MIKDVRIRAFRATDDIETCEKFVYEHKRVLENYGIKQLTSSNYSWINSRSTFVVVVETLDGKILLGGTRIQVANGIDPLPIETATGGMDTRIFNIIRLKAIEGVGELCGLWNSKESSESGIGYYFPTQAAMAICGKIGLKTLFVFCAPHTLKVIQQLGAFLLNTVGNRGTFYYPKIDLLAAVMCFEDLTNFKNADVDMREKIIDLIENPKKIRTESSPKKNTLINIHYDLRLSEIDVKEFCTHYTTDFSKIVKPSKLVEFSYPNIQPKE